MVCHHVLFYVYHIMEWEFLISMVLLQFLVLPMYLLIYMKIQSISHPWLVLELIQDFLSRFVESRNDLPFFPQRQSLSSNYTLPRLSSLLKSSTNSANLFSHYIYKIMSAFM